MRELPALHALQADFIAILYEPVTPTEHTTARLAVYRRNLFYGLEAVLNEVFSVTRRVMGEISFADATRAYISTQRLMSGERMSYAEDFPAWLRPGRMADLARYEWALHKAHHADDAQPATFNDLLDADLSIGLHPSAGLISLGWEVEALHDTEDAGLVDTLRTNTRPLLLWRNAEDHILRRRLSLVETRCIEWIAGGQALSALIDHDPELIPHLQGLLAATVPQGLFCLLEPGYE